jgi:hypothetical protein
MGHTVKLDQLRLVRTDIPDYCPSRIARRVCRVIDTERSQDIVLGCISDVSQEHLQISSTLARSN